MGYCSKCSSFYSGISCDCKSDEYVEKKCSACNGSGIVLNIAHRFRTGPDGNYPCHICGGSGIAR